MNNLVLITTAFALSLVRTSAQVKRQNDRTDPKRLRAFKKIDLRVGETKTVTFRISARDLAYDNDHGKTTAEPGEFKIQIADQKSNFNYSTTKPFNKKTEGKL